MIKTRFRFWAVIVIVCLILFTCVLSLLFYSFVKGGKVEVPPSLVLPFVLLGFTWMWLFFGELRKKAIVLVIEDDFVSVKGFFGLGRARQFELNELEGYKTSLLPTRSNFYEYLYLFRNGKKVAKVSEFYHSNYSEMKRVLTEKLESMGEEEFSHLQELKEIFE